MISMLLLMIPVTFMFIWAGRMAGVALVESKIKTEYHKRASALRAGPSHADMLAFLIQLLYVPSGYTNA